MCFLFLRFLERVQKDEKQPIEKRKRRMKPKESEPRRSIMCRCRKERRVYPSDVTDKEWAILEPLIPAVKKGGTAKGKLSGERSSMALCMCYAAGVPGVCCPMISRTGVRFTCISGSGNRPGSGNRSTPPCDGTFASALGAIPNRVRPFSTVNRSKAVLFVAMSAATTQQKKIQGRKRQRHGRHPRAADLRQSASG